MRTLLITDLHLNSRIPGLLNAQKESILKIFKDEEPDEVIIMGDVFMYRKPSPSELLAFKHISDYMKKKASTTYVLRGNHDSETKADDGITSLSLFDEEVKWTGSGINVIVHSWVDEARKRVFIPHYENENTIIDALEMVPEDYTVFGHFGYDGCLNSAGDADFGIPLTHFKSRTFLGHIHNFSEGQGGLQEPHPTVMCLGTPYTTNYGESFKDNFYAILQPSWDDENDCATTEVKLRTPTSGPRHLVYNVEEIENNLETINDSNFFTFLRVMVGANHQTIPYEKLNVAYVDVKYAPVFDEEELSSYSPDGELFSINEEIISDYVKSANSTISTDTLMEGYRLLKNED